MPEAKNYALQQIAGWIRSTDFRPHPLLRSGHAQTVFAGLGFYAPPTQPGQCHTIDTTDGDRLAVHEDLPERWQAGDRCCLLVHGLGGSHRSPYMARLATKLSDRGVRTFRLDMRGCGAGRKLARKTAHAGRSGDVAAAVDFISMRCPGADLVVVGFSLGANQVLKMLGEWGDDAPPWLLRAMAVAPPIDLAACARNIGRHSRRMYNRWFVRTLVRDARQRAAYSADLASIDWSRPPESLYQFDNQVTAPVNGFTGADQYYASSSAAPLLGNIQRPTLILAAQDDPIVPAAIFQHASTGPQVLVHMTKHGGHTGYFGRRSADPDRNWLEWRVVEFVTRR